MPRKATWLKFETESDFFFDYYLAEKLRMTVAEMRQKVSAKEWFEWGVYYGRKSQQMELVRGR